MRWNKLKKIIIEHPYLISDDFHMSISEAKRIQEEEGFPSFEEMVENARKRSSFPDSAWEEVYTAIEKHKEKANVELKQRKVFPNPFMRRWAIVGLCILLLTGYLTLVPSGRALAASIAKVIVEVLDNGFRFTPTQTPVPGQIINEFEETVTEFSSFDELQEVVNRPLVQLNDDRFTIKETTLYESTFAGCFTNTIYYTSDGLEITLQQHWDIAGTPWFQTDGAHIWEEILWDNSTIMYCFIDTADNNMFTSTAVWEDNIITIYAEDGIPYQDILASLYPRSVQ